jgi:uncharacterized cupredoxin-like copper-binding protein
MRATVVLVPLVLTLAACGGGSKSSSSAPPLQTVQVSEKEFSITPSRIDLPKAGTYLFKVRNDGKISHAFEVEGQKTPVLSPGRFATLTVNLSKGSHQAFCPVDGHRSKGMQATIDVGTTSSAPPPTATTTTTPTSSRPGY